MRQHLSTWVKLTSTFLCATLLFLGRRMELCLDYVRGWRLSVKINKELAIHRKHLKSCLLRPYRERPYCHHQQRGFQHSTMTQQNQVSWPFLEEYFSFISLCVSFCLSLCLFNPSANSVASAAKTLSEYNFHSKLLRKELEMKLLIIKWTAYTSQTLSHKLCWFYKCADRWLHVTLGPNNWEVIQFTRYRTERLMATSPRRENIKTVPRCTKKCT